MSGYECKRCMKNYVNRTRLIRHLNGRRVCRVATNGEDIDRQVLIDTAREICFKCSKCNNTFPTQQSLDTHMTKCIHGKCFMATELIEYENDEYLNQIDDLAYYLALIIKNTYFSTPLRYIKSQQNGYYKMIIEGSWTQVLKKVEMVNIVLNKLACSSFFSPALIKILLKMTETVKVMGDISNLDWEHQKMYHNFFNYIFKLINDQKFQTPQEKLESIRRYQIIKEKNRKYHNERWRRKLEDKMNIKKKFEDLRDSKRKLVREASVNRSKFNYLKDELCIFDDIDISEKNDESALYLAEKINGLVFEYREQIINYYEKKSRREDSEEVANYLFNLTIINNSM